MQVVVYDIETMPNCFLLCAEDELGNRSQFEISAWKNDSAALKKWMIEGKQRQMRMVSFNGVAFDYVVLHWILTSGISDPQAIYNYAMTVINTENKFAFMVRPSDCWAEQIDLFKIHHFDNKARTTSLKALEFNMRLPNISDLPFPPGTVLQQSQVKVLRDYCFDDVAATRKFYELSLSKIEFREVLGKKYGRSFINHNDVKIGKEIFQIALEAAGVKCFTFGEAGRQPIQTLRHNIDLGDCVPRFIRFNSYQFNEVLDYFKSTVITKTKGAFKLTATVGGLDFHFGTGGIHASVENESFEEDDAMMIYDVDVTSLYPSIAIEHGFYPEHLGPTFVDVYRDLRKQRLSHPKNSPENAMLKLALNGVYGASSDPFSIFYDPLFTMKITVAGQLMIAMLAERLTEVEGVKIIQANTDGISLLMPRRVKLTVDMVCAAWEQLTKMSLEYVEYSRMIVADVNSYIAVKKDGSTKRKGRYEHDLEWHKDGSALVVPKIAEQVLLHGGSIMDRLLNWPDKFDFMLRVKATKGTTLVLSAGIDMPLDRTQRYYVSEYGYEMFKIMPPLKKNPDVWRRIAVQKGYFVCPCNDIFDSVMPVDYSWYVNEIEKLILGVL